VLLGKSPVVVGISTVKMVFFRDRWFDYQAAQNPAQNGLYPRGSRSKQVGDLLPVARPIAGSEE